jgi:hypothetical protein
MPTGEETMPSARLAPMLDSLVPEASSPEQGLPDDLFKIAIGRELVATMMRRMGIEALYRRPNTSKPADGHKIYPYLLR